MEASVAASVACCAAYRPVPRVHPDQRGMQPSLLPWPRRVTPALGHYQRVLDQQDARPVTCDLTTRYEALLDRVLWYHAMLPLTSEGLVPCCCGCSA